MVLRRSLYSMSHYHTGAGASENRVLFQDNKESEYNFRLNTPKFNDSGIPWLRCDWKLVTFVPRSIPLLGSTGTG